MAENRRKPIRRLRLSLIAMSLLPLSVITFCMMICEVVARVQPQENNGLVRELFFKELLCSPGGFTVLISFVMILGGLLGFLTIIKKSTLHGLPRGQYQIEEKLDAGGIDFYLTVIIPLISLGVLNGWSSFIAFILTTSFLIWLMWRTNTWYQNPILLAFGFHFYKARIENGKDSIVFVSKNELSGEGIISYTPLDVTYFFVKDAGELPTGRIHG